MRQTNERERGRKLDPLEQDYINRLIDSGAISKKRAIELSGVSATTFNKALRPTENELDDHHRELIIEGLAIPAVTKLEEERRRFVHIPPQRNKYFTGRDHKLNSIREAYSQVRDRAITHLLTGTPGSGKTSTAIEYAYRCNTYQTGYPRYSVIQYCRADTADVLARYCRDIANRLRLPRIDTAKDSEAVIAVSDWMTRQDHGSWLLIIDNLNDPAILDGFLPTEPDRHYGHVIITSRCQIVSDKTETIEIKPFDPEHGVEFLEKRLKPNRMGLDSEHSHICKLVEVMGGLPLGLEQAAAFMSRGERMAVRDYLTLYDDRLERSRLLMQSPDYGFYRRINPDTFEYEETLTILTTWQITVERIQAEMPGAVTLLNYTALLASADIPRELVEALMQKYFDGAVTDASRTSRYNRLINVLADYSLVSRDFVNETHSMHALLATAISDCAEIEQFSEYLHDILSALSAYPHGDDFMFGGRGDLYYTHAKEITDICRGNSFMDTRVCNVLYNMSRFQKNRSNIEPAEGLLIEASEYMISAGLENDDIHLEITHELANIWKSLGDHEQAINMYIGIVNRLTDAGADRLPIGIALANLADAYVRQGTLDEANKVISECLKILDRNNPRHISALATLASTIASLVDQFGDTPYAEYMYKRAIQMHREMRKPHFEALTAALWALGSFYKEQERDEEAIPLFEEAYSRSKQRIQPWNKNLRNEGRNLASLYIHTGKYRKAEQLLKQVLDGLALAEVPDINDRSLCLVDLGSAYYFQDNVDEAERAWLEAVQIRIDELHIEDVSAAMALGNLCILYGNSDRFESGISTGMRSIAILEALDDPRHARFKFSISEIRWLAGDKVGAIELMRRSVDTMLMSSMDGDYMTAAVGSYRDKLRELERSADLKEFDAYLKSINCNL